MMDDKEYADYPGRTWGQRLDDDYRALLRVARAARALYPNTYVLDEWQSTREELYEAIKALPEGLLNDAPSQESPEEAKLRDTPCSP